MKSKLNAKNITLVADFKNLSDKEKVKMLEKQNNQLREFQKEIRVYDNLIIQKDKDIERLKKENSELVKEIGYANAECAQANEQNIEMEKSLREATDERNTI